MALAIAVVVDCGVFVADCGGLVVDCGFFVTLVKS